MVDLLEGLGDQMLILIKPFLCLIVVGQIGILFASTIGLACWLLAMFVRAMANLRWLQVSAIAAAGQVRQPSSS
jgi:hypothetical protein